MDNDKGDILVLIIIIVACFALGAIIGWYSCNMSVPCEDMYKTEVYYYFEVTDEEMLPTSRFTEAEIKLKDPDFVCKGK